VGVRDHEASVTRPVKELRGFRRELTGEPSVLARRSRYLTEVAVD
jgi:hypothetical protein